MWVHSHSLYCNSIKKSMTNIILPLTILCNYGNGKYKLPMYCLYIILHAGIIGLIIFLKPGFSHVASPAQAQFKPTSRLGLGGLWALGLAQHITNHRRQKLTNQKDYL